MPLVAMLKVRLTTWQRVARRVFAGHLMFPASTSFRTLLRLSLNSPTAVFLAQQTVLPSVGVTTAQPVLERASSRPSGFARQHQRVLGVK